jgi:hypothetical protein
MNARTTASLKKPARTSQNGQRRRLSFLPAAMLCLCFAGERTTGFGIGGTYSSHQYVTSTLPQRATGSSIMKVTGALSRSSLVSTHRNTNHQYDDSSRQQSVVILQQASDNVFDPSASEDDNNQQRKRFRFIPKRRRGNKKKMSPLSKNDPNNDRKGGGRGRIPNPILVIKTLLTRMMLAPRVFVIWFKALNRRAKVIVAVQLFAMSLVLGQSVKQVAAFRVGGSAAVTRMAKKAKPTEIYYSSFLDLLEKSGKVSD